MADSNKGNAESPAQPEVPAASPDSGLSRQSQFSTIKENTDLPDETPSPGRHAVEELGKPSKRAV